MGSATAEKPIIAEPTAAKRLLVVQLYQAKLKI